jgi:hypothetical protein
VVRPRAKKRAQLAELAVASLIAAAIALGANAFGSAAIAAAQPPKTMTWDLDEHEKCMKEATDYQILSHEEYMKAAHICCLQSGGIWEDRGNGNGTCVAPPPNTPGDRQVPGDLAIAPVMTRAPLHPVPPALTDSNAPVMTVSQP